MSKNKTLTEDHWTVVETVRDFYLRYELHPTVRILLKKLAEKWGKEKATSIYLHQLFPNAPITETSKLANIPKPLKCI